MFSKPGRNASSCRAPRSSGGRRDAPGNLQRHRRRAEQAHRPILTWVFTRYQTSGAIPRDVRYHVGGTEADRTGRRGPGVQRAICWPEMEGRMGVSSGWFRAAGPGATGPQLLAAYGGGPAERPPSIFNFKEDEKSKTSVVFLLAATLFGRGACRNGDTCSEKRTPENPGGAPAGL